MRKSLEDPKSLSFLLAERLRFYDPLDHQAPLRLFDLSFVQIEGSLAEEGTVVLDALTHDASAVRVCDAQNLESLLLST